MNDQNNKSFIDEGLILYKAKELISFLICPICKGLIQKPILACNNCAIYGCGQCILKWEKYGKQRCLSGCQGIKFEKIKNPLLYAVLDNIVIKCPNSRNENQNERCQEICNYSNYLKHIEKCEYNVQNCQYCPQKMLASSLMEHIDTNHQILTTIYFIFNNSQETPMQYNIQMGQETQLFKILDILKHKVKVEPDNIELVTIHNNRISEYISKQQTLRQLKQKKGFLFAFQKYPQIVKHINEHHKVIHLEVSIISGFFRYFDNINLEQMIEKPSSTSKLSSIEKIPSLNDKQLAEGQNIHQLMHSQYQHQNLSKKIVTPENSNCVFESFTRIFHFYDLEKDFATIHLMIYKYFRNYLKVYVEKKKQTDQVPYLLENIDFKVDTDEAIEMEYNFFRELKEETDIEYSRPYSLVLLQNLLSEFPYKKNVHFSSYYKLDEKGETQFELAIALAPYLDVKALKLNKCLEQVNQITSNSCSKINSCSNIDNVS
ncbi:hypothetical protein ABPG72_015039 [Tetrahymena utriculariae]